MSNISDDTDQARTVYVGNIVTSTSEDHLYELFLQAGPVEYVKIPVDRASKVAKNFAFICYRHECSVPYAIHLLNDTCLNGKHIRVQARENKAALKSASEVGIHSLDPDFLSQNKGGSVDEGSLLGLPPPIVLNQPLISHNPYMNPCQNNQTSGKLYVNSQTYNSNTYSQANSYHHNHRPMTIDTYYVNNMQNNFSNNLNTNVYPSRDYDSYRSNQYYNSPNQYGDRYSSTGHGEHSSYRSNEYRNTNYRDQRNRPYDKYNERSRDRY